MTLPLPVAAADVAPRSPFHGRLVHEIVGLALNPDAHPPCFDDEVWDLSGLAGAPVQLWAATLIFDFTAIRHQPWRWVARELMIGLLTPDHDEVALLPYAYRTRLTPHTCRGRLLNLTRWLNWLTDHNTSSLSQVTQHHCERYLHHHRTRGLRESALLALVLPVKDLARYHPLFTVDRYPPRFEPWPGQTPTAVTGYRRAGENVTQPVPEAILGPALHAGLYLLETVGPPVAAVAAALRLQRQQPRGKRRPRPDEMHAYLHEQIRARRPLPELDTHHINDRIAAGWGHDPLLRVSFGPMAHQRGCAPPSLRQIECIRELAETAVRQVGVAPPLVRDATSVARADGAGIISWSEPLTAVQLDALVAVLLDACLLVTAAISGMRAGELMELTPSSCLPPRQAAGDLRRFVLRSRRFKGVAFGGVDDEWVVIEPAYRAVELAARLNPVSADQPVYGRCSFVTKFDTLRRWVNSPAGARLGLAPIPDGRVTLRMLRRTLALELAHRPNGLFAAQLALKHISVATSEGYAARPGGAQARFRAEVAEEQAEHHEQLTAAAFRDYQAGILPTGPGARELIAAFAHVDTQLADHHPGPPTVVGSDRQIELLLAKRAATLHVQAANYCWFTDPAKALCLKLAGTPDATAPLAGLCDATRCPQATFHPQHRATWASCADTTKTFLGNPRIPAAEKNRLAAEHHRTQQIVHAIDTANAARSTKDTPT